MDFVEQKIESFDETYKKKNEFNCNLEKNSFLLLFLSCSDMRAIAIAWHNVNGSLATVHNN